MRVRHGAHSDPDEIGLKIEFPEYGTCAYGAEMLAHLPPVPRIAGIGVELTSDMHLRSQVVSANSEYRAGTALALAAMTRRDELRIACRDKRQPAARAASSSCRHEFSSPGAAACRF